jgi:hypothetical protein
MECDLFVCIVVTKESDYSAGIFVSVVYKMGARGGAIG